MRSEFEFIQDIKNKHSLSRIGDDCAVMPKDSESDLLLTTDMLVEEIDFRLNWTTPELLGHKALAVSLSDIAAMGGVPKWSMLSIGVPKNIWKTEFIDRLYEGWFALAKTLDVELVGGDISETPGKLVIDSIVGGEVPRNKAVLRSGAKVGDAIVVTDHVGASAGGLKLLERGERLGRCSDPWMEILLSIHLQPWPQIVSGIYLQQNNLAHAMIDISDGLASDLMHICEASYVGARLVAENIPVNINLVNLSNTNRTEIEFALNGGEDYQLLFTTPAEKLAALLSREIKGDDPGLFTVIGEVTANVGKIELTQNNETAVLKPKGFRHF